MVIISPFFPVKVTLDSPAFPLSSTFTSPLGVDTVLERLHAARRSRRETTTIRGVFMAPEVYIVSGQPSRKPFTGEMQSYFSTRRNSPVEAFTATRNFAVMRSVP